MNPALDTDRTGVPNRAICDVFPNVEPYVHETDSWVSMPLRLVTDALTGWHVELGPYSLSPADIHHLADAIRGWERATGQKAGQQ